ncbi:MAG TPA: polysaccharide pyruvyl transferase family protein [Jatrophihabitans sp.]|nr:polysaccharide pyruvyl transferase family protein [Jatrophihabitans sp.]
MSGSQPPRALIAGWFSFDEVIATVGDLSGGEVTAAWLSECGWACDVAMAQYMGAGVDWRAVDPDGYDLLVFTTGPLFEQPQLAALLERFAICERWAINVSLLDRSLTHCFDRVWERDGLSARADLAFAGCPPSRPVVGFACAPPQAEYGAGSQDAVRDAVTHWLGTRDVSWLHLEMDMYVEHRYPRSESHVASLVQRCDVVISSRLHGAVFALRLGKPVIAIDPVCGGGKVARQMTAIRWPCTIPGERVSADELDAALRWCSSDIACEHVARSRHLALEQTDGLHREVRAHATQLAAGCS